MTNSATAVQEGNTQEAVTRSNDQRLSDLYSTHAPELRRMAYLVTGDLDEAEDLLQEAFIRLSGHLLTLHNPERAAGYVYRTVMNLARDHGRRLRRDRELRNRLSPAVPMPSEEIENKDQLWSALMRLPVRHRAVLFLRYYMDLSEAQTAELLGCSTAAVKSLNHRASESLKKQLRGEKT